MKSRTRWWMAAGAIGAVALLAWAFAPRPIAVETAQVDTGPFELAIIEEGRTELRDRHLVTAPVAGRLTRITLREGDTVAAGDTLASLLPLPAPMLDARSRAELQARAEAAQAAVAQARAVLRQQQVALAQARSEVQRTDALAEQGFVSDTQRDTARRAMQAASRAVDAATEAQHVAEHQRAVAQAALQGEASNGGLPPFTVHAPSAGQVLKVHQTSEGVVAAGTPLMDLGDLTGLEVVAELLTPEAMQIAPGATVRIERWGGPQDLEGRVRRIEPGGFTKVSALGVEEQRVRVRIDITSPRTDWQALGDGFRVGVRIVRVSQDRVLRVPISAVFPMPQTATPSRDADPTTTADPAAEHAVFRLMDEHAVLTPLRVTERNADWAWVSEGVADGDTVIVYPPAAVTDGARVAPR
jgi:HlyD family secretion protein